MPDRLPFGASSVAGDSAEEIASDIAAVGQIDAVPLLLEVLCETTGMRFAAVVRVTERTWTVCAVKDDIDFGLKVGCQLDLESTLCIESKRAQAPIFIDQASIDPVYLGHHTPVRYNIESYVSVPIILRNGRYFGNLCAIDRAPASVSSQQVRGMFQKFATVIAFQLENQMSRVGVEQALQDELAKSELREQFVAILGHDLRNPLHAVFAAGELLERRATEPQLKMLAASVRTNAKRMSALINDVLDFARGKLGGGIGLQIDSVSDIETGLNSVVIEFQDSHPERQIFAEIDVERPVSCDLGRVQQVVSNLIGNALAHGAPSSPIKFSASTDDRDLILEVWNAGEPIPPDSVSKIFEPFWRRSTADNRQGLGLGLHICSQIVRAHQGSLSVSSTPANGTTFTARLPLQYVVPQG